MNLCLDSNNARFASVELERRKEAYVFDRLDPPSGKEAQSGFSKCLDTHYAGQNWGTVNLMIVKERLRRWVEHRLDRVAVMTYGSDFSHHGSRD